MPACSSVERLASRGIDVGDHDRAVALLKAIGYYRLTGYLYPFRESEQYLDDEGGTHTRVLTGYRPGTTMHHARLFTRKLQHAPARPKAGQAPPLDHLRDAQTAKGVFGTYNALAVIAYLLPSIEADTEWPKRLATLLQTFPTSHALTIESMGIPQGWESLDLWRS